MSYKLLKPYTQNQRTNFIIKYNRNQGLRTEETEKALYALEAWELLEGDEVIDNTEAYEQEQAQKEAERIARLFLTGADVERGIYQAKGMDFDDILEFVKANPPAGLDVKALKIELKANNFYRGNPYVDAIGSLLGFTKEQLDLFFEDGDYTHLLVKTEEKGNTEEIVKITGNTDVDNSEGTVKENLTVEDVTEPEDVNNSDGDVENDVDKTA